MRVYQALGLEFVEEQHGGGPMHYACITAGIALEIYPGQGDAATEPGVLLGFDLNALEGVRKWLQGLGVEITRDITEIDGVRSLIFADTDGRRVMLREMPSG